MHEVLRTERHADPLTPEYCAAHAKAEVCDTTAPPAFATLLGRDSSGGLISFHLQDRLADTTDVTVVVLGGEDPPSRSLSRGHEIEMIATVDLGLA